MKNLIWIPITFCALIFSACAGNDNNDNSQGVNKQSLIPGKSAKKDNSPIPQQWRPMFRYVANAEVDSMYTLFTEGMHFMINDQPANSPAQARTMLRSFYRENKPASFRYLHNGASKSGLAQYAIGELATEKTNYRVTMVLQNGQLISLEYELP